MRHAYFPLLVLALLIPLLCSCCLGGNQPCIAILGGAWSGLLAGEVTDSVTHYPQGSTPPWTKVETHSFESPFSINIAWDGTPDKLLFKGSAITGVHPGDVSQVEIAGVPWTVTVREAFYSPIRSTVILEGSLSWQYREIYHTSTSDVTEEGSRTETIELTPEADGTGVVWTQSAEATVDETTITKVWGGGVITTHSSSQETATLTGVLQPAS